MAPMLSHAPLLALAVPVVLASPTPSRFLQREHDTKALNTAADFIAQLSFTVNDSKHCGKLEDYTVADSVYSLIREADMDTLYPSDKAVAWFSNGKSLKGWLDGCCNLDPDAVEGMKKCLCSIASAVEIEPTAGTNYQIAAIDGKGSTNPISPTWQKLGAKDVVPGTYSWVFAELESKGELAVSIKQLEASCKPSTATWDALAKFGSGLEAYTEIWNDKTYGTAGQMGALKCTETPEKYSGGCGCRGEKGKRCTTDDDVRLFCDMSSAKCDPRPLLCPAGNAAALPVGTVRAYLHKFLDAIPAFQGTGFTDETKKTAEFIVLPNPQASDAKMTEAESITCPKK